MSTTSKAVFVLSCGVSLGIIAYVHYQQIEDRERMHQGVIRDLQAQEMRKLHNIQELNRQEELKQMLQRQENQAAQQKN